MDSTQAACSKPGRPGWRTRLLGLSGLLAGLLAPEPAFAIGANCNEPDPRNPRQVYECMMSVRHTGRDQLSVFERSSMTSCASATSLYRDGLRRSGYRREEIEALTPSCKVLAQALDQVRGKPMPWAECTDYPGQFDGRHMKTCLDTFLPRYYGGRGKRLAGCADAIEEYEKALRTAMQSDERGLAPSGRLRKAGLRCCGGGRHRHAANPGRPWHTPGCNGTGRNARAVWRVHAGSIPGPAPSRSEITLQRLRARTGACPALPRSPGVPLHRVS